MVPLPRPRILVIPLHLPHKADEDNAMSHVAVQPIANPGAEVPVFRDIARRMADVERRAFELFADRGFLQGRALDDWVEAEKEVFGWAAAELKDKEKEYEMDLTLPGYTAEQIEVFASPDLVVVKAAAQTKKEGKGDKVVWSEFGSNQVCRQISFPTAIDTSKVTAELDNGLLRVHAPKKAAAPPKAIPVVAR